MKTTSEVVFAPGPLSGITILDLTRVLSGPYCTMLAADMGARVIKVEHPRRGDDTRAWGPPFMEGESAYYLSINRNKESVALDFTTADGRAILDALIARADVQIGRASCRERVQSAVAAGSQGKIGREEYQ